MLEHPENPLKTPAASVFFGHPYLLLNELAQCACKCTCKLRQFGKPVIRQLAGKQNCKSKFSSSEAWFRIEDTIIRPKNELELRADK